MTTIVAESKPWPKKSYPNFHTNVAHNTNGEHTVDVALSATLDALYLRVDGQLVEVLPMLDLINPWVNAYFDAQPAADG